MDTVFGGAGALAATPTAAEINTIEAVIRQVLTQLLQSAGLDPTQFNLFTTAFDANNAGFDNILERTQVTISAGGQVTVTMVDPNTGTVGGTIIAMPINTVITAATNPIDVAKTAINANMTGFMNTINSIQCALTGTDIQPYLVTGYLNEGYNAEAFAEAFKDQLGCPSAPTTITTFSITNITAYDDTAKTATGSLHFRMANGNGNIGDNLMFKYEGGSWRMDGDQEIAEIQVISKVANHIRTMPVSPSGYEKKLAVQIRDYLNQIASVSVTGPGVNSTNSTNWEKCFTPTGSPPACEHNSYSKFEQDIDISPVVGSVYTITLTKTDASTISYKRTLIATPGVSGETTDFPNFSFSGTTTHSINGIPGTTITAQVYMPVWITEIATPWVNLWSGSISLGSVDATWTGTPVPGQNNGFTVAIPLTVNVGGTDYPVTTAVLSQDAGGWGIKGWGNTHVYWYFE